MPRFYLPKDRWNSPLWELDEEESRHASRVLRMKAGDSCVVFDGEGRASRAIVAQPPNSRSILLRPDGEPWNSPPGTAALTLCQAVPKGSNMELIVQKAVELGAVRIIPLLTEHTVVRLTPKEAASKQAKWQRTALEACKQCGQNTLPHVDMPIAFRDWVASLQPSPDGNARIIASLAEGALPVRDILEQERANRVRSAAALVGPEGDFTPEETRMALQAGFRPVTLGPIVLRVETASFCLLSMLRYALD